MQEPTEAAPPVAEPPAEGEAESLAHGLGVPAVVARTLMAAGLATVEAARAATDQELAAMGLREEEIQKIRSAPEPVPPPVRSELPSAAPPAPDSPEAAPEGSVIVERWMRTVRKGDRIKRRIRPPTDGPGSTEVLRKWVGGDDSALESWIQSSEPERPAPPPAPAAPTPSEPAPVDGEAAPADDAAPGPLPAHLVEREETVVRWLTDLLDRVKTDQFDPASVVQELQELQRHLFDERERVRQTREELEHVKRGSIAVIKYVRTREAKAREELLAEKDAEITALRERLEAGGSTGAGPGEPGTGPRVDLEARVRSEVAAREAEFAGREGELKRRIAEIEGELRTAKAHAELADQAAPPAVTDAAQKASADRERELLRRESDLRTRFEEIRIRADELERKREAIGYKEQELSGREQEVALQHKALEIEARRVAEAKSGLPAEALAEHPEAAAAARRLEELEAALAHKEGEIQKRELFLKQKLGEVEELQRKAAVREADRMEAEAAEPAKGTKLRSGVRRLDDLLFGGLPIGSQILVNGPAHTGKDILARLFLAEGLKAGHGALWVITDRTYTTVREEMAALYPSYAEAEKKGIVRYVDLYSRSLGVTEAERGVKLLANTDKALLEQLTAAVNAFASELKERAGGYRVVFESVSTVTAYLDATATFRFLQPLLGRRKLDGAAGYYELETGMHSESDLQTLEHMMDGSINLKVDQLKTFLSVRGITDVQSRAWVGYTFSKKAFTLGSFSLDHIR